MSLFSIGSKPTNNNTQSSGSLFGSTGLLNTSNPAPVVKPADEPKISLFGNTGLAKQTPQPEVSLFGTKEIKPEPTLNISAPVTTAIIPE